jgi:hypothetical protein
MRPPKPTLGRRHRRRRRRGGRGWPRCHRRRRGELRVGVRGGFTGAREVGKLEGGHERHWTSGGLRVKKSGAARHCESNADHERRQRRRGEGGVLAVEASGQGMRKKKAIKKTIVLGPGPPCFCRGCRHPNKR